MKKLVSILAKLLFFMSIVTGTVVFITKKIEALKKIYTNVYLFENKEIKDEEESFIGEKLAVLFSAIDIDLRNADVTGDKINIEIFAMFSAVIIRVPKEWEVIASGMNKNSAIGIRTNEENEDGEEVILNISHKAYFSYIQVD